MLTISKFSRLSAHKITSESESDSAESAGAGGGVGVARESPRGVDTGESSWCDRSTVCRSAPGQELS